MIPVLVELINGDILFTSDGYNYTVLMAAPASGQTSIRIKISGSYQMGYVWYRINEKWRRVKSLYMKKDGAWALNKNAIGEEV